MRLAVQVQGALHHIHSALMLAGAGQMDGRRAQSFRVFTVQLYPQLSHIQSRVFGTEKLSDAHGALGDAGIASFASLVQIVIERNIETVALAGYLCGQ